MTEDAEDFMIPDDATTTTTTPDLVALARAWEAARNGSQERAASLFVGQVPDADLVTADATAALLLQLDAQAQKASTALTPKWAALARFADAAGEALAVPLDGAELDAALKSAFGAFVDEIGGVG
jgi:hypothetical protein